MTPPTWHPRYVITPAIARSLMEIEASRAMVAETPLPLAAEAKAPPPGPTPVDPPLHNRIEEDRRISRLVQAHRPSTTKTGYTERYIITCIEVVLWALQSSL